MNDRAYEHQKSRIRRCVGKWAYRLGFRWWTCHFTFDREPKERTDEEARLGRDVMADIDCQWQYQSLHITFYVPSLARLTNKELDAVIRHEFGHALVNEMRNYAKDNDHEERVVEHLARAFEWTYQAGVDAGKRIKRKRKR